MSKSYLYGRPVTEWSTPPTAEGKPTARHHAKKKHPSSVADVGTAGNEGIQRASTTPSGMLSAHTNPPSHAQDLTAAIQGLRLSTEPSSTEHDISWAPLTTIATPSHAPVKHLYTSSMVRSTTIAAHTASSNSGLLQRHCVPNIVVRKTIAEGADIVSSKSSLVGDDSEHRMKTIGLPSSSGNDGIHSLAHSQASIQSHSFEPTEAGTTPSQLHAFTSTELRFQEIPSNHGHWDVSTNQLRRSLSDKQLYTPLPDSPDVYPHVLLPHDSSTPMDHLTRAKTLPNYRSSTPTARVPPLVDTQSKRSEVKKTSLKNSQDTLSSQDTKFAVEVGGSNPGSELERIKQVASSPVVMDGGLVSHDRHMMPGDFLGSAEKWKALIETKDRIMVQKNHLIERQKQTIARLQVEVREGECRLGQALTSRAQEDGGTALTAHLKELEFHNSSLKAELSESVRARSSETEQLTKKLDAAVYELDKLQGQFTESCQQADTQTRKLRQQVQQKEELIRELEGSLTNACSKHELLSRHISKLTSYLGDMPTMEEHRALQQQVHELRDQAEDHSRELTGKHSQLQDSLAALQCKEQQCTALEQSLEDTKQRLASTQSELRCSEERVSELAPENSRLASECNRLQRLLFESEGSSRAELQAMRERHKHKFLEATAGLRTQHKALAKRVKLLEAQLLKNSDAVSALNSELQLSQGTIGNLKSSVRELVHQNQELVEQNITLQETSAEATKVASSLSEAQAVAAQQLASEVGKVASSLSEAQAVAAQQLASEVSKVASSLSEAQAVAAQQLASEVSKVASSRSEAQAVAAQQLVSKVASSLSEAQAVAAQQLASELTRCVEDFDSLVSLSSSIIEGRDPGASLVLGVKGQRGDRNFDFDEVQQYEEQLGQVRRLQGEVERLREMISDQFAAQVSSACNVQ